jgi:hypothetical protein
VSFDFVTGSVLARCSGCVVFIQVYPYHFSSRRVHLDALLVGLGGALVLLLVDLVASGVKGAGGTVGEGVLAGDVALGLLLVGLLGGGGGGTLDGLGNVVGGVLMVLLAKLEGCEVEGSTYGDGVGDLTDDALVGSVGVGGRHVDGLVGGVGWFECCLSCWMRVCVSKVEENRRRRG